MPHSHPHIAPCGLDCGKCLAFAGSEIQVHAQALRDGLGPNFGPYAERFTAMNPAFADYPAFAAILDFLARGSCQGCRGQGCLLQNCPVQACVKERGVEFCFECPDFPCQPAGFPERLTAIWKRNNELMRDKGLPAYAAVLKDKPRYP